MKNKLIATVIFLISFSSEALEKIKNYDVFIIPDPHFAQQIEKGEINERLKSYGLQSLSSQGFQPHITLYLTEYYSHNLGKLKKIARNISEKTRPFPVHIDSLSPTKNDWLMLMVRMEKKDPLQALSDDVVDKANKLRNPNPTMPAWVNTYPNKALSFKKYGSPNVFGNFDPHITVLTESDPDKLSRFMAAGTEGLYPHKMQAIGIGVSENDQNGQPTKILARFCFKGIHLNSCK